MAFFSLFDKKQVLPQAKAKIIPESDFNLLCNAQELVDEVSREIAALRAKTKEEMQHLKEKARNEGRREGLSAFNQHILFFDQKIKEIEIDMQRLVLPLALKAAKKIVADQLTLKPDIIVDIVIKILKSVSQSHRVRLLVNKADRPLLEAKTQELRHLFDHLQMFVIEERSEVEPGGCIVETEAGIINATLENQWRALEAAFASFKTS